jgi:hypothetical protein
MDEYHMRAEYHIGHVQLPTADDELSYVGLPDNLLPYVGLPVGLAATAF